MMRPHFPAPMPKASKAENFVPMTRSERQRTTCMPSLARSVRAFGCSRWGQPASQLPSRMGPGAEGFGRRYGNAYAQRIIGQTIENGLAFDYMKTTAISGRESMDRRLGYAITSHVVDAAR